MPKMLFETMYSVPVKNGELVVSRVKKGPGEQDLLSISPLKPYVKDDGQPSKFIPRNSSLQLTDAVQLATVINTLTRACLEVFEQWPTPESEVLPLKSRSQDALNTT